MPQWRIALAEGRCRENLELKTHILSLLRVAQAGRGKAWLQTTYYPVHVTKAPHRQWPPERRG